MLADDIGDGAYPFERSARRGLEAQLVASHFGPSNQLHDPLCLGLRNLDERELLKHADVANRLSVETRRGRYCMDDVGGL
jgi:hypothetical protein